jgi:NADH-quinone oxidoreductase subunit M
VLAACVLFMGLYPAPFVEVLRVSVNTLLEHVAISKLP